MQATRFFPKGLALFAILACASAAQAQHLFEVTERGNPGDPVNLFGDGVNAESVPFACEVGLDGNIGRAHALKVLSRSVDTVQAEIPFDFKPGVWQLWVENGGHQSNRLFVNKPDLYWIDQDQVLQGGAVTLFGRNFELLGQSSRPTVRVVAPGGAAEPAQVQAAGPYTCTVQLPSDLPVGNRYRLVINNGNGGAAGDEESGEFAIVPPSDPFHLEVGWGSDFGFASNVINVRTDPRLTIHASGNGADDQAAIQAAIQLASGSGGGVVYLPAGEYRIPYGRPIKLESNVVLKGDGTGKTQIDFGYDIPADGPAPPRGGQDWEIQAPNCQHIGLFQIRFRNLNPNPGFNQTIMLSNYSNKKSSEVFVKQCDFQLGNGDGLFIVNCRNLLVSDSSLESTSSTQNPVYFTGGWGVTFRRNRVLYRANRMQFSTGTNVLIEDNDLRRDPTNLSPVETGCLELSSIRFCVARHNTLVGIGAQQNNNDGEMINSQVIGTQDVCGIAPVSGATRDTLTCSGVNWPTTRKFMANGPGLFNRSIAIIVQGKGLGQWRYITGNTADTLTLDRPWDVTPDSSSLCSFGLWSADRTLILDNSITKGTMAVLLWSGGYKCVVDGNQAVDSGCIFLRGDDTLSPKLLPKRAHEVAWDNWISNNTLTENDGLRPGRLLVVACDATGTANGNLVLNNEVRGNTMIFSHPGMTHPDEYAQTAGLWVETIDEGVPQVDDPISSIGTLLIGNNIQNLPTPVHVIRSRSVIVH